MSRYQNDIQSTCTSSAFPACGAELLAGLSARGKDIKRVGVIGADAAAIDVAASLLDAGVPVTLFEVERASLERGIALAKGDLQPDQRDKRMALLAGTIYLHHLKDCDLIVDAAPTDTAGKEKLFRRLDQAAKPGAVLVTDAAHGIDGLAGCTRRAREVLGVHFAGAADTGGSWRIVPGKDTSSETLGTVVALASRLNKAAAVCDTCHGPARHQKAGAPWKIDQALE